MSPVCPVDADRLARIQAEGLLQPFTETDWYGFAGAEEGCLIHWADDCYIIQSPTGEYEVGYTDEETYEQYAWQLSSDGVVTNEL